MSQAASARLGPAPTLARLHEDFERASRAAGGTVELRLTIAESTVCLRFAGPAAAEALIPAFAHLHGGTGDAPALTLHVWDSATAGAERPGFAPPREADAAAATGAGASFYYEGSGFRALHQPAYDALSVLSVQGDKGWFWVPDAEGLPWWEYTAPCRHLLSWWLAANACRHVHGGAVGTSAGGVLLVGPAGSGKSTTALASLLDERLRYAGDDYVAVGGGADPVVHSLYCCGKLDRRDLHRLPHLTSAVSNGDRPGEKAVVHVPTAFPGRSIAGFPMRAIVLPRVTDQRATRVVPGTHAAALTALAPSTIFQLHPPAPEALAQMAQLVRTVPTFVLELGTEVETIPNELVRLLERIG